MLKSSSLWMFIILLDMAGSLIFQGIVKSNVLQFLKVKYYTDNQSLPCF